jgi:class 3 adenylate cyclase
MQRIADWLEKLGLGQYVRHFAENGIDASVLGYLTDQDLEKIGVLLGHRRKMLAEIAELGSAAPASQQPVVTERAPQDSAERRQVTVMFSDLVGSTALSARMDPEDLREVISAYQKCVAETMQRFGGFVAKFMGDGVLIYFGYPQAHEDDAERAVRAGLELVAAVGGLKAHAPLQTRVGIATGLVVVGDLIGSGASQEQAIVGETPNLAARLQGIAEPNSAVIAESTRKLVGNLFELEDLGAKDLKGIAGPVRPWAVLRPASVESRFEALHASGLTELVGREEELELLLRRWSKAKTGGGQVVLLSGEAGIGKSRLTAALMERLAAAQPETLSRTNPVLMIFEDVHWIDPTSLEALSRTVDRIRTISVLLIVTYRPEFEPPWVGRPYVTALSLNRLGEREIAALIDRVIGNQPLPASIRQDIIERTDGIPLFVEEMTKAVLEAAGEGATERAVGAIPSSSIPVPASLHASLMARLDRLGHAKEVAQVGAVIGREFSHALLAAVARKSEVILQSALDRLIGAGLLFRQGMPPYATYLFKHALVQDAAYGTLLREPRRLRP